MRDLAEYGSLVARGWWSLTISVIAAGYDVWSRLSAHADAPIPEPVAIAVALAGLILAQYLAFRDIQLQSNVLRDAPVETRAEVTVAVGNQQTRSGPNVRVLLGWNNTFSFRDSTETTFESEVGKKNPKAKS